MRIELDLSYEQDLMLTTLAKAQNTTPEGMAIAVLARGLREELTDELIARAQEKDRERIHKHKELAEKTVWGSSKPIDPLLKT